MTWWAVGAAIVGSAGSAVIGSNASRDASREVTRGNAAAIAETGRQFDTIVGLQRPYNVTGTGAFNMLARLYGLPYAPYQDPASVGAGGGYGTQSRTVGRSGLGDPLGLPDPLGIFGSSGRRAEFAPGPGQGFSAREVSRMLKRGVTLDEIDELGKLETTLSPRRLRKLMEKRGLSVEDIQRLQYGEGGPEGAASARPDIVTPEGPDLSVFQESPDYQFRQREGAAGIDRAAASGSGALSGNVLRAQTEYASDLASTEFSNFFGRLATLAGVGQQAAGQTSQAAAGTGNTVANILANSGQARASGVMGQANSITGALDSGLTNWLLARGGYFDRPAAAAAG